jgi:hypothetical protein
MKTKNTASVSDHLLEKETGTALLRKVTKLLQWQLVLTACCPESVFGHDIFRLNTNNLLQCEKNPS